MASHASRERTVGLFDIRVIIGGLVTLYGLILVLLGLFNASEAELDRGDGLNINLWAGIGMLVVGLAFIAWARWRPLVIPEDAADSGPEAD